MDDDLDFDIDLGNQVSRNVYDVRLIRRLAAWVQPYRGLLVLGMLLLMVVSALAQAEPAGFFAASAGQAREQLPLHQPGPD